MFKNSLKLAQNRNLLSILMSLIIFICIYILIRLNFLYIFDKNVQDLYFKFKDININKSIVVVEIDDVTLTWRKNNEWEVTLDWLGRFPFDRANYAKVIDNLTRDGAAVIWLDIIFWEKSNDESDNILSKSITESKRVVLWAWSLPDWTLSLPYNKFRDDLLTTGYYLPNINKEDNLYENERMLYSIKPFSKFKWSDIIYSHFSIALLKWYYSYIYDDKKILTPEIKSYSDKFVIHDKIQLLKSRDNKNEVLINYTPSKWFSSISFLDVYYWKFKPGFFKDKIVIVWATARWIKDIFTTPFWDMFWVYTHANMINTVLSNSWIKYVDTKIELLMIFLLIIISVYFNISKSLYVTIFSNIAILTIFIVFVVYITMITNLLLNYIIELSLALLWSILITNIVKYLIENKHKRKLNKALSEYVSKDIAHEILSWEWRVDLNWENKDIAIFFSDIEGFTSISEKFTPEDLVWFLREYLSEMSNIILDEKWFINKYEWDAIMALWWVFGEVTDCSYYMCLSALKQQEILKKLNEKWKERGFSEIKARIGMHYWSAIIWNIWAEWRKMEFTALWDSVNLASRLEWVNKMYWTYMCASEDVYNIEKNNFEFRYLDKIRVKWKKVAVNIYELLSIKWKITDNQMKMFSKFDEAIDAYKNMNYKWALTIFSELSKLWDKPSIVYQKRCEIYINNPPDNNWDWVWIMTTK